MGIGLMLTNQTIIYNETNKTSKVHLTETGHGPILTNHDDSSNDDYDIIQRNPNKQKTRLSKDSVPHLAQL